MATINLDKKTVHLFSDWFVTGILLSLCRVAIYLCVLGWIVLGFANALNIGTDDSDINAWHRSGLKIYTDHLTGVQYMSNGYGLTPRLNPDGTIHSEKK